MIRQAEPQFQKVEFHLYTKIERFPAIKCEIQT